MSAEALESAYFSRCPLEYSTCYIANALTVFADEDQAVNENSTSLEQIRIGAGLPMPFMLKENHRNSPEIARVAEHFHTGGLPACPMSTT